MEPDNNQLYRAVFEQAPDAMAIVDTTGVIILTNRKALEITGYPDGGELIGKNITQILAGNDLNLFGECLGRVISSGVAEVRELGLQRKDGSVLTGEFFLSLVPGAAGSPGMVVVTFRDVSERLRAEKSLNCGNPDAEPV